MAEWNELPHDVLVEILLKLSVKSLSRLCCVSKKLCALIKNSKFASLYSKCNKQDILLVQRDADAENHIIISFYSLTDSLTLTQVSTDVRLPYLQINPYDSFLIGPCNGLICVNVEIGNRDDVVLCNPALQEFKLLPPTTFSCRRGLVKETAGLGLGFDPCTNDYKLVRLVYLYFPGMITDDDDDDEDEDEDEGGDEEGMKAEVYDLRTNLWRKIEAQVPYFFSYRNFEFFYKGCCHISGWKTTICFNISSETFTFIKYPESIVDSEYTLERLTVLNDRLSLVSYNDNKPEPELIDIWVMKEYGNKESWVKQFTIGPILVKRPLSFWRDNFILFEGENKQLICCELGTNKVTKLETYCHREYVMQAIIYRESFVSIQLKENEHALYSI